MAGLSREGLEIKRLRDVIRELEQEAKRQYGEDAATDVNSVLGRALRIVAPATSDVWESVEQVYDSFNPYKASGSSLDALAALGGLTRYDSQPTTSPVVLVADKDTTLPAGSLASSTFTKEQFALRNPVFFNLNNVIAVQIEPVNAVEGNTYTITFDNSDVSYTALAGDTVQDILTGLQSAFSGILEFDVTIPTDLDYNVLYIASQETFRTYNFELSPNLVPRQITKLGNVEAVVRGPKEQPEGTIDKVAEPIRGWVSVRNPVDAETGTYRETDTELRLRFARTKETRASNTLEAIYSDISSLLGVEEVTAYENVKAVEDARGFPPHSITTIVEGGSAIEIGKAIWKNKPAGIETFGNTTVTIVDSQGFNQDIDFIRPVEVPVYIDLTITALQGFDAKGPEQIKQAIIDFLDSKYGVGDNIIYSRLYTPINSVPNHQIESMSIGTDPQALSTDNIEVLFDQISKTRVDYINVNVTV